MKQKSTVTEFQRLIYWVKNWASVFEAYTLHRSGQRVSRFRPVLVIRNTDAPRLAEHLPDAATAE